MTNYDVMDGLTDQEWSWISTYLAGSRAQGLALRRYLDDRIAERLVAARQERDAYWQERWQEKSDRVTALVDEVEQGAARTKVLYEELVAATQLQTRQETLAEVVEAVEKQHPYEHFLPPKRGVTDCGCGVGHVLAILGRMTGEGAVDE